MASVTAEPILYRAGLGRSTGVADADPVTTESIGWCVMK